MSATINGSNGSVLQARYVEVATTYTAVQSDFLYCDTSAGAFTVTLPANPANNNRVSFLDISSNFATANLTIGRNGKNIMGLAEDLILNLDNDSTELIYINGDWRII